MFSKKDKSPSPDEPAGEEKAAEMLSEEAAEGVTAQIVLQPEKRPMKKPIIIICSIVALIGILIGAFFIVLEAIYANASSLYDSKDFEGAGNAYGLISFYRDSDEMASKCRYENAVSDYNNGRYAEALSYFTSDTDHADSAEYAGKCNFAMAVEEYTNGNYDAALSYFESDSGNSESNAYAMKCHFEKGRLLLAENNFEGAKAEFEKDSSEEAKAQIKECNYQIGVAAYNKADYDKAFATLTKVGDYKDANKCLTAICLVKRYDSYGLTEKNGFTLLSGRMYDEMASEYTAEQLMSKYCYADWYSENTNNELIINQNTFGDNPYIVLSAYYKYEDYGSFSSAYTDLFICVFDDGEEVIYHISDASGRRCFDLDGNKTFIYGIMVENLNTDEQIHYYDCPVDEFNERVAISDQYEENQKAAELANATSLIVEDTFKYVKSALKRYYYTGTTNDMVHHCSHSDDYVWYDESTGLYNCSMIVTYSTNIFNFFGFENYDYYVLSQYQVVDGVPYMTNCSYS